ncbi:helix-turn-helix transcriptional regulator, partial [Turicibacter sanguinis]|uniref:helix-turn-helix transcriptional regulator n=1 Tax=Turicibacter sanguinis TaxID=154288 RepID=UPI00399A5F5C
GIQRFLTTVLKGEIYYSEDELDRYVKMYHLFEPQLSLYRLRVKENDKIEDDQFPYIDAIIREQFRGFDFDVVHINHEKVLIILYEREVLEDLIITDRWIKVVRSVRNYLNTDLQASKRVVIDSRVKLAACTKLFQDQVRPDQQISLISDEELAHYRPEVQLVLAYIHEHYVERITLQELADYACLNEAYLSRIFKIETHKTLNNYLNELRISKAKQLLKKRDIKVKEVAQLVGIKDQL